MDTNGARRLNRSSPSCLNRPAQQTDFFHGLIGRRRPATGGARPTTREGSAPRQPRGTTVRRSDAVQRAGRGRGPGFAELVSYPSSAPHNSRHGPLVDFVPTGGKLSALAYATVSLFDVDRHWSIGPRQERVDLCHVFPGRHTSPRAREDGSGGSEAILETRGAAVSVEKGRRVKRRNLSVLANIRRYDGRATRATASPRHRLAVCGLAGAVHCVKQRSYIASSISSGIGHDLRQATPK